MICSSLAQRRHLFVEIVCFLILGNLFYNATFSQRQQVQILNLEKQSVVIVNETTNENQNIKAEPNVRKRGRRLPDAIIIGVQKGGTKILSFFLTLNPQIVICDKELNFFSKDEIYKKGLEWYRKEMPVAEVEDIVIEISQDYMRCPDAPARVYDMNKDTKIIAIFRDPVERAVSEWVHNTQFAHTEDKSIDKVLFHPNGSVDTNSGYIKGGLYFKQIQNWLKYFPKEQILLLDGHEFEKDPTPVLNEVEDFFFLPRSISANNVIYDNGKRRFCRRLTDNSKCESKFWFKHPGLPKDTDKKLHEYYRPFNKQLNELVGIKYDFMKS